ncbi:MAG: COX15/CtaA family protein, partial [Candidatus Omnitrophica bacterium]|nr:COX15/CtaA family protein [Candidatus Omnitrophota bacterium]
MNKIWLARYTKLLAAVTFLLIIAGGLVTSTQSGLSVPDWPLSYGKLMPPMVGGIRYEHTHRMIASLVGLMTLILALWLGFRERRVWMRWLGITAFGAVVVQGILGGLTVLYLLPAPISIFHACLAQTFFALVVSVAFFTSGEFDQEAVPFPKVPGSCPGKPNEPGTFGNGTVAIEPVPAVPGTVDPDLKAPLFMMLTLLYLQLILGATLRHTSNPGIVISHIAGGFFVLMSSIVILLRILHGYEEEKQLVYPGIALGISTLVQVSLGLGAFIYISLPETIQPPAGKIFFVTAHQTLGALLLAICVLL